VHARSSSFPRRTRLDLLITGLAVLLGGRAALLFAQFSLHARNVQRHHVETAFTWFVLVGAMAIAVRGRGVGRPETAPTALAPVWLPVLWALAIAIYLPALSVGFLSDDYTILPRVAHWQIGAVHATFVRPVPLILWSLLENVGAPSTVYHLVNVLLHGTNAYLSGLVIGGWVQRRWAGELGALLVLTAPIAVEAVTWCSGISDLLMTTFALGTVLLLRRYEVTRSPKVLVACLATGTCTLLSKETGLVLPALLVCDALARRSWAFLSSTAFRVLAVASVVYAAVRAVAVFSTSASDVVHPITKYMVQQAFFQTYGGLADPWHIETARAMPALVVVYVLTLTLLFGRFAVVAPSRSCLRVPLAAAMWIASSIAPVGTFLLIPGDLQESRYLYLALCAWSGVVYFAATEAIGDSRPRQLLQAAALAVLLALSVYSIRGNLQPWRDAASVRDRIFAAARVDEAIRTCRSIAVADLPDTVHGAYVFRNGAAEAFHRDLAITVGSPDPTSCAFRWDTILGRFIPTAGATTH
jgi:hypothetical protein